MKCRLKRGRWWCKCVCVYLCVHLFVSLCLFVHMFYMYIHFICIFLFMFLLSVLLRAGELSAHNNNPFPKLFYPKYTFFLLYNCTYAMSTICNVSFWIKASKLPTSYKRFYLCLFMWLGSTDTYKCLWNTITQTHTQHTASLFHIADLSPEELEKFTAVVETQPLVLSNMNQGWWVCGCVGVWAYGCFHFIKLPFGLQKTENRAVYSYYMWGFIM